MSRRSPIFSNRALDKPTEQVQVTGDGSPIVISWQGGYDGKESVIIDTDNESDKMLEVPSNIDEKIRRAR